MPQRVPQPRPLSLARTRLLLYMLEAHETSEDLSQPAWNFACQLPCLLQAGMTESALRWLLEKGLATHRVETTVIDGADRTFTPRASLHFQPTSCFLLTPAGIQLARSLRAPTEAPPSSPINGFHPHSAHPLPKPHYDAARRTLFAGQTIIKQFRVPAENQELILTAFEEEGWPVHLDDPLPPVEEIEATKRLLHAIYRLNSKQTNRLIRFEGNGRGNGVKWRWVGGGVEVE